MYHEKHLNLLNYHGYLEKHLNPLNCHVYHERHLNPLNYHGYLEKHLNSLKLYEISIFFTGLFAHYDVCDNSWSL